MKRASSTSADKRLTSARRTGTILGLAALVAASLVAAAPADASSLTPAHIGSTQAHTVDITGADYDYRIDTHGTVPAGLVKLHFTNRGPMAHQAQLFRLNDGVTYAKFLSDLQTNPGAAIFVDASAAGGPGPVAVNGEQTVWEAMQSGTYAVICLVSDSDGIPHYDKGMVAQFTVAGHKTSQELAAVHPAGVALGVIDAHDMTFTMPHMILNGALYRYQDTDAKDVHELLLGRLLPGKTVADAKAWFDSLATPGGPSGPQPFVYSGGFGGEVPGGGGWLRTQVQPGNYVAFCLVPDSKTGTPHAALGMVVGFTAV